MGRNPYWYVQSGATRVLASTWTTAAWKRRARISRPSKREEKSKSARPTISIRAAQGTFDRVTWIGVLHHLAEPEARLPEEWSCVAPKGILILWCYGKEGNRLICRSSVASGGRLARAHRGEPRIAKAVALAAWPVIQLAPWRTDYYRCLRSLSFRNVESIIFDQMLPHIAHYWSREDMERLSGALSGGVSRIEFVQENSWNACITKSV